MRFVDGALLLVLAAIWGGSFVFMRVLSPVLGPVMTATVRALVAGIVLVVLFQSLRIRLDWRKNFRHYVIVAVLNSALPFLLFSYAALHVVASVSSIVNALTPLWGAVFAAALLQEPLTVRKLGGIAAGFVGVLIIALFGGARTTLNAEVLPIAACALATVCYGISGVYIRRWAPDAQSSAMTAVSLLFAGVVLLPLSLIHPPVLTAIRPSIWLVAVAFSLLCSAVAYLIYFRLILRVSVTFALSVTLLIPVFAFVWGLVFLGETVRPGAYVGAVFVLSGTALIGSRGRSHRAALQQRQ